MSKKSILDFQEFIGRLLADKPVAHHPDFALCFGGIRNAIMLEQLIYWSFNPKVMTPERDGWFYKSLEEFYIETGLTECEQQTARAQLAKAKIILYERRGIPPTTYYKIDLVVVVKAMTHFYKTGEPCIKRERTGKGRKNSPRSSGRFVKNEVEEPIPIAIPMTILDGV
jgi:hypothetical protein